MSSGLVSISLFSILIVSCGAYSWPSPRVAENPSPYKLLEQYDFPVGLLPQGATGYDLNPTTGEFSAYLNGTCTFTLAESFYLKYESTVSGRISKDLLRELRGVSFVAIKRRLRIVEVRKEGEVLVFSVGPSSADFPAEDFAVSPKCGCGFICNVAEETEIDHHRRRGIYQNWMDLYLSSSW
ncbi:OLC1v1004319C1 [Oldenlandia corymbosa var. corymbosa]|uniref:OLC1v1004319C1 n=1 Tax=Oldenlandia corymbosa var. corymbosa TaxID=529605 RepID=A0AAV1DDA1_OLDCO|nr:OLC1v1004319C1 [Oldenlandia corymbosa var. corymbosa]